MANSGGSSTYVVPMRQPRYVHNDIKCDILPMLELEISRMIMNVRQALTLRRLTTAFLVFINITNVGAWRYHG